MTSETRRGPDRRTVLVFAASVVLAGFPGTASWSQDSYRGLNAQKCAVVDCSSEGNRNRRDNGPSARDLESERQRQANEAAYNLFIQQVDAAKARRDWAEALRLARQYQGVLDAAQARQFIESMEFHIARDAAASASNDSHDYPRAIALLQEALRHRPGDRDTLDTLQLAKNNEAGAARRARLGRRHEFGTI